MKTSITVAFVLVLTSMSASFAVAATKICKRNLQNNVRLQPDASTNHYAQVMKQDPSRAGSAASDGVSRHR